MRLSPKRTSGRLAATVDRVAAGSEVPAGQDPAAAGSTTARERGIMRRRVRRLRRVREVLLHELGALVFEMERRGRRREALLRRKVDQLRVVEDEAAGLSVALGTNQSLSEIVSAGIVGSCRNCGTLVSTDARFCSNCATPVGVQAKTSAPVATATPGAGVPGAEPAAPVATPPAPATADPATAAPATATLPTHGPPSEAGPAPESRATSADSPQPVPQPHAPGSPDGSEPATSPGLSREAAGDVPQRANPPGPGSTEADGGRSETRDGNGAEPAPLPPAGEPEDAGGSRSPGSPLTRG